MRHIVDSSKFAAILGFAGVIFNGAYSFLRERSNPVLLPPEQPGVIGPVGAGKELTLEPLGLLAVTDDRILLWLLFAGIALSGTAIIVGYRNARKGASDHMSASGFAFGVLGVIWGGLIAAGLV